MGPPAAPPGAELRGVVVHIWEARNLQQGSMVARLHLEDQQGCTAPQPDTNNPMWFEEVEFDLPPHRSPPSLLVEVISTPPPSFWALDLKAELKDLITPPSVASDDSQEDYHQYTPPKPRMVQTGLEAVTYAATVDLAASLHAFAHKRWVPLAPQGEICLSMSQLHYPFPRSRLLQVSVMVVGAHIAPSPARTREVDPYLVLRLDRKEFKTSVCKKTLAPVWNEGFTFDVGVDSLLQLETALMDEDWLLDKDLGEALVDLAGLALREPQEVTVSILSHGRHVVAELLLHIEGVFMVKDLVIGVHEAAGLAPDALGGEVFVQAVWGGAQEHRTTLVPAMPNPEWHEALLFTLHDPDELHLAVLQGQRVLAEGTLLLGRSELSQKDASKWVTLLRGGQEAGRLRVTINQTTPAEGPPPSYWIKPPPPPPPPPRPSPVILDDEAMASESTVSRPPTPPKPPTPPPAPTPPVVAPRPQKYTGVPLHESRFPYPLTDAALAHPERPISDVRLSNFSPQTAVSSRAPNMQPQSRLQTRVLGGHQRAQLQRSHAANARSAGPLPRHPINMPTQLLPPHRFVAPHTKPSDLVGPSLYPRPPTTHRQTHPLSTTAVASRAPEALRGVPLRGIGITVWEVHLPPGLPNPMLQAMSEAGRKVTLLLHRSDLWRRELEVPCTPHGSQTLQLALLPAPAVHPVGIATLDIGRTGLLLHRVSIQLEFSGGGSATLVCSLRPLLFSFPRQRLLAITVTVEKGHVSLADTDLNHPLVELALGDALVETEPSVYWEHPVWKASFRLPITPDLPLCLETRLRDDRSALMTPFGEGSWDFGGCDLDADPVRHTLTLCSSGEPVATVDFTIRAHFCGFDPTALRAIQVTVLEGQALVPSQGPVAVRASLGSNALRTEGIRGGRTVRWNQLLTWSRPEAFDLMVEIIDEGAQFDPILGKGTLNLGALKLAPGRRLHHWLDLSTENGFAGTIGLEILGDFTALVEQRSPPGPSHRPSPGTTHRVVQLHPSPSKHAH